MPPLLLKCALIIRQLKFRRLSEKYKNIPAVHEPAVPVRLMGTLATSRRRLLAIVPISLRLGHPDVLGPAGTHVARMVLQLPDKVLQIAYSDRAARGDLVFVFFLWFYHLKWKNIHVSGHCLHGLINSGKYLWWLKASLKKNYTTEGQQKFCCRI